MRDEVEGDKRDRKRWGRRERGVEREREEGEKVNEKEELCTLMPEAQRIFTLC